jgi:ribonucleotide monophosphatase NagD (HAD superfamily)
MDLQWMAESVLPRFGHGAFLLCLESLYKKITGHDLEYTALVGKPSELTYVHGEQVRQRPAIRTKTRLTSLQSPSYAGSFS